MKIVILRTNTSDFGKVGTYNVQEIGLANALIRKGHDVDVLFLHRDTKKIVRDEVYNNVYYLPHKTIGLHGIFDVNLLERFQPDRVILFSSNQLWAKNVIRWCKKRNITCVQYFGAVLSNNPQWLHQAYTKLILRRNIRSYSFSINVAKTNDVKEEMLRLKVPFSKVINIGLDKDLMYEGQAVDYSIRERLGYKEENKILLFIGRLIDYKRPMMACDILKELRKVDDRFQLIIIGKGALKEQLLQYIKDEELSDYVQYIERVPYSEIYKYMVASDCLINLSPIEIFGMTILEAMYYSLPVVAQAAPGPKEIIKDNVNGFLLDTEDIAVWRDCILDAIARRSTIGSNARQHIIEHFLWDSIAEEFLNV